MVTLSVAATAEESAKPPERKWREIEMPPLRQFTAPRPEVATLSNGMAVYLIEDHEVPTIDLVVLVRAGSTLEPRGKAGLASIAGEVMRTGGTDGVPPGKGGRTGDELDEMLESTASSVEVGISLAEARASLSCLKENFGATLPVLMDVLERPAFRQDKIDLAKKQRKSAIARRNDDPSGIARREYARTMYGDSSPYGWTEEVATIDAITREDLVAFHKKWFGRPESTMVGVVGDFDAKEMKAGLEAAFGKWDPPPRADLVTPPPKVEGAGPAPKVYFVRKSDVNQATIVMGHLGMQRRPDDPDYAATIVANDILGGGGFAARLLQRVRTEMGLAYGVYSHWNAPYSHRGTFSLMCQTKSGSTVEAIKALRRELERIIAEPVTADELRVAKQSIQQQLIFESETRAQVLERALRYAYWGFPADYLERFQAAVAKVGAEDVRRVAKERFRPDRLVTLVVGNDAGFDAPLSTLGEVVEIDVKRPAWPPEAKGTAPDAAVAATPEQIEEGRALIAKAVEAKGGREALSAVKTVRIRGKGVQMTPMGPMPVEVTQVLAYPDRMRMEIAAGPMTVVYACDADSAWAKAPQGVMDLPESQAEEIRGQVRRDEIPLLLELLAETGRPVHAGAEDGLEIVEAPGGVKLYFDADRRLVRRSEPGAEGEQTSIWSDFRAVAGVEFPFAAKTLRDGQEQATFTVDSIEVNVEVPAGAFARPEGNEMQPGRRSPGAGGGARPPAAGEREKAGAGH